MNPEPTAQNEIRPSNPYALEALLRLDDGMLQTVITIMPKNKLLALLIEMQGNPALLTQAAIESIVTQMAAKNPVLLVQIPFNNNRARLYTLAKQRFDALH